MRGKTHEKHHAAHMAHGGHHGHHHRKRGGGLGSGGDIKTGSGEEKYAGGNPYVEEEAEKKHGGKVKHHKKRKRGGRIHGKAAHHHLGHRGRKRGGKAGADLAPLSSASRSSGIGHQAPVQSEKMSPD